MSKLKVVWLCHLTNREIQDILKPRKRVKEYAPWMFISLKIAEQDSDMELHIVAPHEYISKEKQFTLRGIHYHFFNPYIPLLGRHWPGFFRWDFISGFHKTRRKVSNIINKIKPDVIHLFGAENPQYSSGILPLINKYPTILTVQGFISHTYENLDKILETRISIEKQIVKRIPISFYSTKKQASDISQLNPKIELMHNFFGSYKIEQPTTIPSKKYDLVYFARISKDKGIEDLIHAISKIKSLLPDISLCVIGGGKYDAFQQLSIELGLSNNIHWIGFLPTREEVWRKACQCRISVLPTYHDIIPGTIIESMFLGLPVISYATDSIPEINEKGDVIRLVEKGNVNELSKAILEILSDDNVQKKMSKSGIKRAEEMFNPSPKETINEWHKGYKRAINLFNKKNYLK